jgi:hypothetical protein
MPKDNEVDEKVMPVAWIVTNGGESCEPWLEYEQSEVDALPAVCIAEPLYSAATVAELRAEVEGEVEELRGQMEIVWRYLQKVSPWSASNDMLWCDEIIVGIDLLATTHSQPQQPAEAVAVDLEQFREPVRHWKAHVTGLANDAMRRGYSRDVVEAWENEEQNAGRLLAIIDNAPPAIDIGKLLSDEVIDVALFDSMDDESAMLIDYMGMGHADKLEKARAVLRSALTAALIGDGGREK